jgi:hypothetical protein
VHRRACHQPVVERALRIEREAFDAQIAGVEGRKSPHLARAIQPDLLVADAGANASWAEVTAFSPVR